MNIFMQIADSEQDSQLFMNRLYTHNSVGEVCRRIGEGGDNLDGRSC
jgi:hypothetical protein